MPRSTRREDGPGRAGCSATNAPQALLNSQTGSATKTGIKRSVLVWYSAYGG